MNGEKETEAPKKAYYTEGYISWIEVGGKDLCRVRIEPVDGWNVSFNDRKNILLASMQPGEKDAIWRECALADVKRVFSFYGGTAEDASLLEYGFILELKMKRIRCGFRMNGDFDIDSIEIV